MCKVCSRPERALIDAALEAHGPTRAIAGQFGVSRTTLQRYDADHRIKRAVLKAAFVEGSEAPNLIVDAHRRITRVIKRAMSERSLDGDKVALLALKERREYLAYEKPPVQRTKDETPRDEWATLPPAERAVRVAEMKHRLLELEQETREEKGGLQ